MREDNAFTLIELIVVILLVSILAAIGMPMIFSSADAINLISTRGDLNQNIDLALSRMSREINRLGSGTRIGTAIVDKFGFEDKDLNSIYYYLDGTNLMRNSDILADNITNLEFIYYNNDGEELSPPIYGIDILTDVRRIEIRFTLTEGASILKLQSQIMPMNLRHFSYEFY